MSLADDLQHEINNEIDASPRLPVFERPSDIVDMLGRDPKERQTAIAVDMFIAFREPFHGGWMLWLGDSKINNLTPAQKEKLPSSEFRTKAKHLFRLSLWSNNSKANPSGLDITDIPDGAEIYVGRVTGVKLYTTSQDLVKLAQGNASRVELVTRVDDEGDAEGGNNSSGGDTMSGDSQEKDGTDTEQSTTQSAAELNEPTPDSADETTMEPAKQIVSPVLLSMAAKDEDVPRDGNDLPNPLQLATGTDLVKPNTSSEAKPKTKPNGRSDEVLPTVDEIGASKGAAHTVKARGRASKKIRLAKWV